MKFRELTQEQQEDLLRQQKELVGKRINTIREVLVYNDKASRYFHAWRVYNGVRNGDYGNPSHWVVRYGAVSFKAVKDPFGGIDYEICNGIAYAHSANGTAIPSHVDTKKEVMRILKNIGIFNI